MKRTRNTCRVAAAMNGRHKQAFKQMFRMLREIANARSKNENKTRMGTIL